MKRFLLEATTLIVAAVLCAFVANALASRERKLALVGSYPNALKVPQQTAAPLAPEQPAAPAAAAPVAPTESAPVVQPPPAVSAPAAASQAKTPAMVPAAPATAPHPSPAAASAPAAAPAKAPDLSRFVPHPDKAYLEIAYPDVAALHASGALFLDARRSSVYEQGHIAGARPFPVWESDIDQRVNALFGERGDPREQALPIVVYCSGGECEDSHMLAQKLWGIQFNNVYVYRDGYPDWQKRGGAVHTGTQP